VIEPRLSPATRALLRAAKVDAPSAVARAKVWSNVAGAVGGAAGAAGAASTASTAPGALLSGGAGASKVLALGTLFGGTVTVGLAAMLLRIGPVPQEPPSPSPAAVVTLAAASPAGRPDSSLFIPVLPLPPPVLPPAVAPASITTTGPAARPLRSVAVPSPATGGAALSPHLAPPMASVPPSAHVVQDDALAREASLVVQAREALGRGDPHAALRAIHAARMLPSHQLRPEELAVEARALRALGRDDQAKDVDATLRKRFPESALAP
jgi:hypothetical protein